MLLGVVLRTMEIKIKGDELPPIDSSKMNICEEKSVERKNNEMSQRRTGNYLVIR